MPLLGITSIIHAGINLLVNLICHIGCLVLALANKLQYFLGKIEIDVINATL